MLKIAEFPNSAFSVSDFEPVEYVSFSKALEWLKEGYTINRKHHHDIARFKLVNGAVTFPDGSTTDKWLTDAILANDWYWVEKPEGK